MKKIITGMLCLVITQTIIAQNVAINNDGSQPNASAMLDIKNTNKGLLIPRVSLTSVTDVATIPLPVTSLLVFNTNPALPDGLGFYFWNSNNIWSKLATVNSVNNSYWGIGGNGGTNPNTDFIGTTDNTPLVFKTNNILSGKIAQDINSVFFGQHAGENATGINNSFFGHQAGAATTTGDANTAMGTKALFNNTDGSRNIAVGFNGLLSNTSGSRNIAVGNSALNANTSGFENTAIGNSSLYNNTTGHNNSAIGVEALYLNTTGHDNTALGFQALYTNNTGADNIALGRLALYLNTSGFNNIANGYEALYKNTTGANNNALGNYALYSNTSGNHSNAMGFKALYTNTTGNYNIAIGDSAMVKNKTGSDNIAFGNNAMPNNTTGDNNIALGNYAMPDNTTGDHNIAFGNNAMKSNTIGYRNIAIGNDAMISSQDGNDNIAIGNLTLNYSFSGIDNIAIGGDSGPTRGAPSNITNTVCLGGRAAVVTSNTMIFGNYDVDRWAFGLTTTNAQHALEVGYNSTNGNGAYLTQGGNWTNTSSRIKKENFTDLNSNDLLQKISQLSIQKWKYKGTDEYHIGPVAEDFYAAFGLGVDDKGISTVDPAGIALAAIKEQQKIIEKQNEQLKLLIKRIDALEKK